MKKNISRLKRGLLMGAIIISILLLALVIFYFWGGSGILDEDQLSQLITYPVDGHPTKSDSIGNPTTFKIMTYNIGYLSAMTNNRLAKPDKSFFDKNLDTFTSYIKKNPPHVIAFQEIDYHSKRSFYVDQLEAIANACGYKYAAQAVNWDKRYVPFPPGLPSYHFGPVLSGQAVLSSFLILSAERVVLPKPAGNPFFYNHFYLDRLAQVVKIKINDQPVIIINVHLEAFSKKTREIHAGLVLELYKQYKDRFPVFLVGDFNAIPPEAKQKKGFNDEPEADFTGDKTIKFFMEEESLKPAFLSKEIYTFPANKPTRKLDYVFYTHRWITLIDAKTVNIDSSDHLPLVIEFSLLRRES